MASKKPVTKAKAPVEEPKTKIITQEDLDNDPTLVEQGIAVGDEVEIEEPAQAAPKAPANKAPKKAAGQTSTTVEFVDPNLGLTTRVFDVVTHGEKFHELANTFVESHADKGARIVSEDEE